MGKFKIGDHVLVPGVYQGGVANDGECVWVQVNADLHCFYAKELLPHGYPAKLEALVEAVISLKRSARHINSLGTEWKVSGDDLAAVEAALAAFEKGEGE